MEFLIDLVTTVPEGTSLANVDDVRAAEAVRSAELATAGHLVRLWRAPGAAHAIGLFRAADEAEMHDILASLPLYAWMTVTVTPLTPHPHDPEYRARQATEHPGR